MTRAVTTRDRGVRDRLRRLEGQIGGTVKMIDEGRSCEDVVTQLMAVRGAIDRAAAELVSAHVDECMTTLSKPAARARVHDAVALLGRLG